MASHDAFVARHAAARACGSAVDQREMKNGALTASFPR
jgi:hypothetical protein